MISAFIVIKKCFLIIFSFAKHRSFIFIQEIGKILEYGTRFTILR